MVTTGKKNATRKKDLPRISELSRTAITIAKLNPTGTVQIIYLRVLINSRLIWASLAMLRKFLIPINTGLVSPSHSVIAIKKEYNTGPMEKTVIPRTTGAIKK
jgi:hypothetical protein